MCGDKDVTKRERGWELVGRVWWPVCVTAIVEPLPTTMSGEEEGRDEEIIPGEAAMCDVAPESRYHSPPEACPCCRLMLLRAWMRKA